MEKEKEGVMTPKGAVEDAEKAPEMVPAAPSKPGSFAALFSTMDCLDFMYMLLGSLGAVVVGLSIPAFMVLFGEAMDGLNDPDDLQKEVNKVCLMFVYIGSGAFVMGYIQATFWSLTGDRQVQKLCSKYVRAILSQEIGWFDTCGAGELSTRVAEFKSKLQDGFGRKMGDCIQYFVQIIASFLISFYYNWRLALVLCATIPLIGISAGFMISTVAESQGAVSEQYAQAGSLASESLSSIRTVTALNAQPDVITRYRKYLLEAMRIGLKKGFKLSWATGCMWSSMFLTYALAFWYGGKLVADALEDDCLTDGGCVSGGEIITTFFCIIMGAFALGQVAPPLQAVAGARAVTGGMMEVIKRKPLIDGLSEEGLKPEGRMEGRIELRDVTFAYPTRPDINICTGYNLTVAQGMSLALVGPSGSGKSTVINLLLRFYDPQAGSVCIDGKDVRDLNVKYLRSTIGYVGQEPILFPGTVFENIAYGLDPNIVERLRTGGERDTDLKDKIKDAAKLANAHDFISNFPQGYDTDVGTNGGAMSGGQKQRIAIARALIKKPAVLLLDEATSALDNTSEKMVQDSINKLQESKLCTTIIIAHRLSTIRNADQIAVVKNGSIAELGTHEELIEKNGVYADLVHLQMTGQEGIDDVGMETVEAIEEAPAALNRRRSSTGDADNVRSRHLSSIDTNNMKDDAETEPETVVSKEESKVLSKRVNALIWQYPGWLFASLLGSAMFGGLFPAWGYVLAISQANYYLTDPDQVLRKSSIVAFVFLGMSVIAMVGAILQIYGFTQMGERITCKVRSDMFEAILRREVAYFDNEDNSVGRLTSRLANDANTVSKAFGLGLSRQFQCLFTLIVGLGFALFNAWKMALVVLATFPITVVSAMIEDATYKGAQYGSADAKDSQKDVDIISNAFTSMRTVTAFSVQYQVAALYEEVTLQRNKDMVRGRMITGLGFAGVQATNNYIYAFLFWFGAKEISSGDITFEQMFIALMSLLLAAFGLGAALGDLEDTKKGFAAAKRIFQSLDDGEKSPIDGLSKDGVNPESRTSGKITLSNVNFSYPTRPDAKVCKDYNLTIEPGEVVALVGPSGSGKSTIMNLLLRFYDPHDGTVELDGQDVKSLNVRYLRSQIGYVGQEPVLFQGSIASNVAKGRLEFGNAPLLSLEQAMAEHDQEMADAKVITKPRTTSKETIHPVADKDTGKANLELVEAGSVFKDSNAPADGDVIDACKQSNAHEFIMQFTDKYDTDVGEGSIMVSGGQKQRIAIARALIKKPAVLLLDEATSALDSASEKMVQESIDALQQSKMQTTLVIAHRLTTIKNSDKIAVIDKGQVVEIGKHDDLLAQNGLYAQLWAKQNTVSKKSVKKPE